jgi:hypothetical protein
MKGAVLIIFLTWAIPATAADFPGSEALTGSACIACHEDEAAAWRDGPHGAAADTDCLACHGPLHASAGSKARQSTSCVDCHGGEKGVPAHSYRTSKHGVIATLEGAGWNWSERLSDANYRAPTCAYCHMHDGTHGQMLSADVLETSCLDCHSPRYVETMFSAGRGSLTIADLKLAEASAAIGAAPEPEIARMLETMRTKTLRNLRLGVGHQSPDYQWWYGHAALDGDLLRIKSALSRSARQGAVVEGQ